MGKTTMAAGNTNPKKPVSFTAVMFATLRDVIKTATTTTNASEYPSLRPTAPCLDKPEPPKRMPAAKDDSVGAATLVGRVKHRPAAGSNLVLPNVSVFAFRAAE